MAEALLARAAASTGRHSTTVLSLCIATLFSSLVVVLQIIGARFAAFQCGVWFGSDLGHWHCAVAAVRRRTPRAVRCPRFDSINSLGKLLGDAGVRFRTKSSATRRTVACAVGKKLDEETRDLWEHARAGNPAQAAAELRRLEPSITPSKRRMMYNTAIKAAAEAGNVEQAFSFYAKMRRSGVVPNQRTFGKLLNAAWRARDMDAIAKVFQAQKEAGFRPDGTSFSMMLKAVESVGSLRDVEHWLDRFISEQGFVPGSYAYLALIQAASKEDDDLASMQRWLRRAVDSGQPLPTLVGNIASDAYARAGNNDAAQRWFDWALSNGVQQAAVPSEQHGEGHKRRSTQDVASTHTGRRQGLRDRRSLPSQLHSDAEETWL